MNNMNKNIAAPEHLMNLCTNMIEKLFHLKVSGMNANTTLTRHGVSYNRYPVHEYYMN